MKKKKIDRSKIVTVRMTEEEYGILESLAHGLGLSLSGFIRMKIVHLLKERENKESK